MKRADEPLKEELLGLCVIGAVSGGLLFGGPFGALLGINIGPMLGSQRGKAGNKFREAGWATWNFVGEAQRFGERSWRAADARYDLRGRWARFDAQGRWRRFDASHDVSGKAAAVGQVLVRRLWLPLVTLVGKIGAFCERRGITARAKTLWERTTIPRRWRDLEQQMILRARIDDMKEQQRPWEKF